uniref:Tudor domain-containing protein n=1 Tax=Callorhinchus milii TaxID=7868 RepID=A0A4W3HXH6_CALMI
MALRFRAVFPYTLPGVLALLGWWWYITRKKGRENSPKRRKLDDEQELSNKAGGSYVAVSDCKCANAADELTNGSEPKEDEVVVPQLVVSGLQAETLRQLDAPGNALCTSPRCLDTTVVVENDVQNMLLESSSSQELLFMSNVQGPLQTSPKVEVERHLQEMIAKISTEGLEIAQTSAGTATEGTSPVADLEAEEKNSKILLNSGSVPTKCELPVSDLHSMERPEPEGEIAGNTTEPQSCFKATLNASASPFLITSAFCPELQLENQPGKETFFGENCLHDDSVEKLASLEKIEEVAAELISGVITAAKEELLSSQISLCKESEHDAGSDETKEGKLGNSDLCIAGLQKTEDVEEDNRIDGRSRHTYGENLAFKTETALKELSQKEAFGDITDSGHESLSQTFTEELNSSTLSSKASEEFNPKADDSGCFASYSDGQACEGLKNQVALCTLEKDQEGVLDETVVAQVCETICKETLDSIIDISSKKSGTKGSVSSDLIEVAFQGVDLNFTEELKPTTNGESLEEVNLGAEDSGCSACPSEDGAGGEDLLHSTAKCRLENHQVDVLTKSVAEEGSCVLESAYANGAGADRNGGRLPLEVEVDHSGGSDVNSMDSNDSGCTAGGAEGQTKGSTVFSATQDKTELAIWEIQVPKHLVGRLIGKQGRSVSFLKQTSGAKIYISTLPYTQDFQICHIEGNQQQVDKAINLIGKKFKELDLTNLYAPPALTLPSLPMTSWLMLPDGVTVEVMVVNIVHAGHMFIQQHTHPTYHALRNMDQQMFLCYSQPGIPALPTSTEVGVICAAPAVDGAWWRAQVVAYLKETNEVEIRYVDYGGYERVKMDVLKQIRSDFVTLPFQSTEVLLDNIVPVPGEDQFSEEANAAIDELTRGAALLAQVWILLANVKLGLSFRAGAGSGLWKFS